MSLSERWHKRYWPRGRRVRAIVHVFDSEGDGFAIGCVAHVNSTRTLGIEGGPKLHRCEGCAAAKARREKGS